MKIYISLRPNGMSNNERELMLLRAITEVESAGHKAVYPHENAVQDLAERISMMLQCDAIYLLPKWYESRVCCSEKQVAENYHKKILFTIPEKSGTR